MPFEIKEYSFKNKKYKSVVIKDKNDTSKVVSFFIEQLAEGKAEPYFYIGKDLDNSEVYFLEKGEKRLIM